jgi:uncharacterized pyridoxamine 5'-phosphate oxidase family protein|tara:strand:+ start:2635 stop:4050 length:1416 start_codon:yes stop_codon:yes gene_type:complete
MSATLKIKYFNTFILRESIEVQSKAFPAAGAETTGVNPTFHIEESRIKGGFNEPSVGLGLRAYIVDKEYKREHRENALIYSGIFNARTGVNDTNVFSIGESITKAVDIADGSIQKLYAEESNLTIFQENKVSRALIDKDAIFTAEGGQISTTAKVVIGQIAPYAGEYGISKNPESFAQFGYRKYFTDADRGVVLRLSRDGITEISSYGMSDFFKDTLKQVHRAYGMFDVHTKSYVLSITSNNNFARPSISTTYNGTNFTTSLITNNQESYKTITFDDRVNGWTSFFSYEPKFGVSVKNKFFTGNKGRVYQHYTNNNKNTFYGVFSPSIVELITNQNPSLVKQYGGINYEGTQNWKMTSFAAPVDDDNNAVAYMIPGSITGRRGNRYIGFTPIEKKYYAHLKQNNIVVYNNNAQITSSKVKTGVANIDITGVKGFFANVILEHEPVTNLYKTDKTKHAELFSVGFNYEQSLY